ncbi:MAG: hypothetical protein JWM05_3652 [Acidimicrobiales bacterium]|nr:hypothetical protein [Acidimicrobiales bacterium]
MPSRSRSLLVAVVAALALAGCGHAVRAEESQERPARVERVPGRKEARVHLTALAAKRLGIRTERVRKVTDLGGSTTPSSGPTTTAPAVPPTAVVPFAAVVYLPSGEAFAYTNPSRLVFVRARIVIDRVAGGQAFVTSGPPVGTRVVTVGATELIGVELGAGE